MSHGSSVNEIGLQELMEKAQTMIDTSSGKLNALSMDIWNHPETNFKEHYAHKVLTEFLEKEGFKVERHFVLKTAFRYLRKPWKTSQIKHAIDGLSSKAEGGGGVVP